MKNKLFFAAGAALLLAATVLVSCCSGVNESQKTLTVDIDYLLSNEKVSIYDMFSKVELIALDSTCPISNSVHTGESYLTYDGENFYVLDERTYKVNVYKDNGDILCHADKVGRGPSEYAMGYQIEYNPSADKIEILNPMGKILQYETGSFEYVSELNFMGKPLSTHNFCVSGKDYILYSSREEDKLYVLCGDDSEVMSFGYTPPEYLRKYISPQSPFFYMNDAPCIFRPYDGLIYMLDVSDHTMNVILGWDFGKYQCRFQDIPYDKSVMEYREFILDYSQNHIASFFNIKSVDDRIFASVIFKGNTHTVYYDLRNDQTFFFRDTIEEMLFLPELFHGNVMYKFVDCKNLPDFVNRSILDVQSQQAYDKVVEEEGAAIIKYTLK